MVTLRERSRAGATGTVTQEGLEITLKELFGFGYEAPWWWRWVAGEERTGVPHMAWHDLDSEGPHVTGGGSHTTTVPRLSVPRQGQE